MTDATRDLLEQHFDTAFAAPDGIAKLRELILTLAMQGKLVEQAPADQPASELLKDIDAEKQRLVKAGKIKAPKPLPPIKPEEVPYQLPQGWEWVRLGGIASYIQRGKGPTYTDFSTHQVISQKCVRWYGLDLEPARYIAPESLQKYEAIRFLRAGDLLWNSTGTGTIGRACLVPENVENHEIVVDSHVTVVRPVLISPLFLWRWIQSPIVQDGIEGSASGTTNQIELNTSTVINHLMPLPPLPEQHRIVARIDRLMACCDALEALRKEREEKRLAVHAAAMQQLLAAPDSSAWGFIERHFGELYSVKENVAELRKAILQLAAMGRLVPQDRNDPPANELLRDIDAEKQRLVKAGKIKAPKPLPPIKPEEVFYELPQGWKWMRLGELGITQTGTTPPSKDRENYGDHIPFIGPGDIKGGSINYSGYGLSEQGLASGRLIDANSILMVCIGGSIGKHAIAWRDIACNQQINTLTPYKQISEKYIFYVMGGPIFQNAVFSQAGGSATPIINKQKWSAIPVPIPPAHEQYRIVARIDQFMALCDTLDQKINDATDKQTELLDAVMAQI